jgi:hypothetical protein
MPGPPGTLKAVILPGEGAKLLSGSSALMRNSMAWPSILTWRWDLGTRSPAAMRICCWMRSMPVTSFGDGVLDLDAGVHLHEVELAAVEEELDGAGALVADGAGGLDGGVAHVAAEAVVDDGRGLPR